jgi:hypothetical protein
MPRAASGGPSVAFSSGPSPGLINNRRSSTTGLVTTATASSPPVAQLQLSSANAPLQQQPQQRPQMSEAELKVKRLEELLAQKKRGNIALALLLVLAIVILKVPTTTIAGTEHHHTIWLSRRAIRSLIHVYDIGIEWFESLRQMATPLLSQSYDLLAGIHYSRIPGMIEVLAPFIIVLGSCYVIRCCVCVTNIGTVHSNALCNRCMVSISITISYNGSCWWCVICVNCIVWCHLPKACR